MKLTVVGMLQSLSSHSYFKMVSWALSLTIFALLYVSFLSDGLNTAHGEIYTYEKDGVIVISTEPPPRPTSKRRKKKMRSRFKRRSALKAKTHIKSKKIPSVSVHKPRKRSLDSLYLPSTLRRLQDSINHLALKYHLPHRLVKSVLLSCIADKPHLDRKDVKRSQFERYTCLSLEVSQVINHLISSAPSRHKSTLPKTKKDGLINNIENSIWLLRKLVNRYRGDTTLALSSYYQAAQQAGHPIYAYQSRLKQSLNVLINKSPTSYNLGYLSDQGIIERAQRFTRLALSLFRGG